MISKRGCFALRRKSRRQKKKKERKKVKREEMDKNPVERLRYIQRQADADRWRQLERQARVNEKYRDSD